MASKIWTIESLLMSSGKLAAWRGSVKNYSSSAKRIEDKTIPFAGTNSVLFQFSHHGTTEQLIHRIHVQFHKLEVDYIPGNTKAQAPQGRIILVNNQGERFYVDKPKVNTPVKIRCSCSDFFYRFAYYDWQQKAIFGRKPRTPKLKGTGKSVNPDHHPGLCKHVVNSFLLMQTSGIITR